MNYEALIDFNKYTLALAAGGFVYGLEKFGGTSTGWVFLFSVLMHFTFLGTVIVGVLIFATATSSLHDSTRPGGGNGLIRTLGIAHIAMLASAMVLLGILVSTQVIFADAANSEPTPCSCNANST